MTTDVGAWPARTYALGPALLTLVLQHVVSNLGYTGRTARVIGTTVRDPNRKSPCPGSKHWSFRRVGEGVVRATRTLDCGLRTSQAFPASAEILLSASSVRIVLGKAHQYSDAPRPFPSLRSCRQWPKCRATKARNEFAPSHLQSSTFKIGTVINH
jgi:hypothetical protein